MKQKRIFSVGIVGGGRVGSVIGRMLVRQGQKVSCVISQRTTSARKAARFIGTKCASVTLDDIPADVNLLILAVPHEAIGGVSERIGTLKHLRFPRLSVCHTSGMLTAGILGAIGARGATVFSFHPLQTFPRDFRPENILGVLPGIFYGVDGSEKGFRIARKLSRILKGNLLRIPPEMRELYHASCVVASNHLTAMIWVLQRMFQVIDQKEKNFLNAYAPIMQATLANIARTSPSSALSGPVARGGVETVAGHLRSTSDFLPELLPYFVTMTEETTRLALHKGSITMEQASAMRTLVASYRDRLYSPGIAR